MTFDQLLAAHAWRAIADCAGRFSLPPMNLAPSALVGAGVRPLPSTVARDRVLVAAVQGGGLISYVRPDGTFVHTLGTREGFARKLAQLALR